MKVLYIMIFLLSTLYAETSNNLSINYCNSYVKNLSDYVFDYKQDTKNYKNFFDLEYKRCAANNLAIFGKKSSVKDNWEKYLGIHAKLFLLTPSEFKRLLNVATGKEEIRFDLGKKKGKFIYPLDFLKLDKCQKDGIDVLGIKLGCDMQHQKNFKVDDVTEISFNKNKALLINLSNKYTPYHTITLDYLAKSQEVYNVSLFSDFNNINKCNETMKKIRIKYINKLGLDKSNITDKYEYNSFKIMNKNTKISAFCLDDGKGKLNFIDIKLNKENDEYFIKNATDIL